MFNIMKSTKSRLTLLTGLRYHYPMTQKRFLSRLRESYKKNVAISRRKNSDYADDKDAFKNFRLIEKLTGGRISTEDGILVRLTDKLQRIANLLTRKEKVADEKIFDTLADASNYAMILKIYIEHERGTKSRKQSLSRRSRRSGAMR